MIKIHHCCTQKSSGNQNFINKILFSLVYLIKFAGENSICAVGAYRLCAVIIYRILLLAGNIVKMILIITQIFFFWKPITKYLTFWKFWEKHNIMNLDLLHLQQTFTRGIFYLSFLVYTYKPIHPAVYTHHSVQHWFIFSYSAKSSKLISQIGKFLLVVRSVVCLYDHFLWSTCISIVTFYIRKQNKQRFIQDFKVHNRSSEYVTWSRGMSWMSQILFLRYWQRKRSNYVVL